MHLNHVTSTTQEVGPNIDVTRHRQPHLLPWIRRLPSFLVGDRGNFDAVVFFWIRDRCGSILMLIGWMREAGFWRRRLPADVPEGLILP